MKLKKEQIKQIERIYGKDFSFYDIPSLWRAKGLITSQETSRLEENNIFLNKFRNDMEIIEKGIKCHKIKK